MSTSPDAASAARPSLRWRAAAVALVGCAPLSAGGVTSSQRWSVPAAARHAPRAGVGSTSVSPLSVRVEGPREGAEQVRARLLEALRVGDEAALTSLVHAAVEGLEGDRVAGRAQVVAHLRAWQPMLAQGLGGAAGSTLSARLYHRGECQPSTCGEVFLRDGDWLVVLDHPLLIRRGRPYRPRPGMLGPTSAAEGAPPRRLVLREVDGALRVVAVNDDMLAEP